MTDLFDIECRPPWLIARFAERQRMMSWSLNRPGVTEANAVAWLQLCDADLPLGVDPLELLERRLAEQGLQDAVGLMTARDIRRHHQAFSEGEGVRVDALVTLGLTNGATLDDAGRLTAVASKTTVGTINTLIAVSRPLSEAAMLEAISVATMARTAALLSEGGRIVGSGTDCMAIACPNGEARDTFAGLHTAIGRHLTASVFQATRRARTVWEAENAG